MSLRTFCLRIFQHCPLLASFSVENHTRAFEEFLQYKTRVPVRGAILLNHDMDATVLVKGWKKGANWSFPRGKINKDEDDLDCAVREVWEETGLDLRAAGLVPTEAKPKYIEIAMREQQMRLYVFRDVPMDTNFEPQTRKEISKIEWYKLSELPAFRKKGQGQSQSDVGSNANKFYMVAPFLVPLKKWVVSQKKQAAKKTPVPGNANLYPHYSLDEVPTEDDTWAHQQAAAAAAAAAPGFIQPNQVPGIDTLEGATNELQRLLKVQPVAQAQPSTQEDKATALLSMLKVKDTVPQPAAQSQDHQQPQPNPGMYPHTPLEMGLNDLTQPPNPHHHTNNRHHVQPLDLPPPPAFPLPHGHQGFDGASHTTPLVHTQPLPPQVQRSVLNKSTFPDNFAAVPPPPPPHNNQHYLQPQQPHQQPAAGYGAAQAGISPSGGKKAPLNGQSMALLGAFKRDSPSTAQQPGEPPASMQNYAFAPQPQQFSQYPQQSPAGGPAPVPIPVPSFNKQGQPPRASELAGSMSLHKSPVGSFPGSLPAAHSPADSHRSALLGMFKPGPSPQIVHASPHQAQAPMQPVQPHPQPQPYGNAAAAGSAHEQSLLDAFRGGRQNSAAPITAGQAPQVTNAGPGAGGLANLFASQHQAQGQHAPTETGAPQRRVSGMAAPMGPRQPSGSSTVPSGPVRILQRGQDASAGQFPPNRISSQSPYSSYSNGNAYTQQPPLSSAGGSQPSPVGSQRRPDGPQQDRKGQLLSLFGNKQDAAPVPGPYEAGRGSGSGLSSRTGAGRQTPMSPADQTFLLDYLQSVTKGAPQ